MNQTVTPHNRTHSAWWLAQAPPWRAPWAAGLLALAAAIAAEGASQPPAEPLVLHHQRGVALGGLDAAGRVVVPHEGQHTAAFAWRDSVQMELQDHAGEGRRRPALQ
jgi:hypothetical protein